ncbi:hypothetical protein PQI23_04175, partial [Leucobacter sp. USCH14]|uniref:hypothetical protein n=1 Tax=Leucobacter sp. USCH14 TaxID=3024838 RepID=UPI0030B438C3
MDFGLRGGQKGCRASSGLLRAAAGLGPGAAAGDGSGGGSGSGGGFASGGLICVNLTRLGGRSMRVRPVGL